MNSTRHSAIPARPLPQRCAPGDQRETRARRAQQFDVKLLIHINKHPLTVRSTWRKPGARHVRRRIVYRLCTRLSTAAGGPGKMIWEEKPYVKYLTDFLNFRLLKMLGADTLPPKLKESALLVRHHRSGRVADLSAASRLHHRAGYHR